MNQLQQKGWSLRVNQLWENGGNLRGESTIGEKKGSKW